jgi:tetratricopeptide (TPR) repeat protein
MTPGKRRIALVVVGCAVIAAAWYFQRTARQTLHGQLLVDARAALASGNHAEAEKLSRRIIVGGGSVDEARLVAAEAAVGQGADERALAYLEPLLVGTDASAVTALAAAANIRWDQGDVIQAERHLRRIVEIAPAASPENSYATAKLAYLLTLTGRHWESGPLRLSLVQRDSFQFEDLLLWGNARALVQTDELGRLRQLAPEDPLLMLGAASVAARNKDEETARRLLPAVIAARPDLVDARALEGYLMLDQAGTTADDMRAWNSRLPAASDEHPDIWVVRGLWTKQAGEGAAAGRCFWEAVKRSPNHHTANYQLALVLGEMENQDAAWFRERAEALEELQRMLGILDTQRSDIATMQRVVELNDKLGRAWEVWGWSRVALLVDPSLKWAREARDRAAESIKSSPPQVLPESNPASRFDYSASPLPQWLSETSSPAQGGSSRNTPP